MDVVQPLISLALSRYSKGKLLLAKVYVAAYILILAFVNKLRNQSQTLAAEFLSRRTPFPKAPLHDCGADYAIQYSDKQSVSQDLLHLGKAGHLQLSHLDDVYSERVAFFAVSQVKDASGGRTDVGYQLSVFTGASLRKKAQLAWEANMPEAIANLVEPGFTVVGHDWNFYAGYCEHSSEEVLRILELDFAKYSSSSISGLYRLLKVWGILTDYALGSEETTFWGGFFRPILNKLASEGRVEGIHVESMVP